ncbi:MAG: NADH-quinone oxidoreductase subunit J [Fidelibacterota bacterium]
MSNTLFILIAAITIASAIWVVTSGNLIYSAVALLFTLFGVAGLYVFLFADFLAATQVVVYVGGILVLIIFGVMLTNKIVDNRLSHLSRPRFMAGVISFFIFILLMTVISTTTWHTGDVQSVDATVHEIGKSILTTYLLPFEVASLLLLAALMGSALLSRKKHG